MTALNDLHARIYRRRGGPDTWGVQLRSDNNKVVWVNGEGWELDHAKDQVRDLGIRAVIIDERPPDLEEVPPGPMSNTVNMQPPPYTGLGSPGQHAADCPGRPGYRGICNCGYPKGL